MPRKPNYGLQRADVNRAKQAKQEAKQREREEAVARRKAAREGGGAAEPAAAGGGDEAGTDAVDPARNG